MEQSLRANGKLLLTGEYFVLDGVPGLAVPTRLGQTLGISEVSGDELRWEARAADGSTWFAATMGRGRWMRSADKAAGEVASPEDRLVQLLAAAEALSPDCTDFLPGHRIVTRLEFDRAWGLGSSSTLVACLARLLGVNPYALLERTFGGSGYDLACAVHNTPILYERKGPVITPLPWRPAWADQSVFVYRNQKQNSREGIRRYRNAKITDTVRREITDITTAFSSLTLDLRTAAELLAYHERLVAETLGLQPVQEELFPDFPGQLKSLGAWGGDFLWVLSELDPEKTRAYFNARGYPTVISYDWMVLPLPADADPADQP